MPPGVTLAAELVDEIDRFFEAIETRCDFRKGREVPRARAGSRAGHDQRATDRACRRASPKS